jgi:transglutaminase-like putative cysteine protease
VHRAAYDPARMIYDIEHSTEYRFHRPVALGLHRLTFRPRDGHDMRVLATELHVTPEPQRIDLVHDVYGNSVALVQPASSAERLRIVSRFSVDHLGEEGFSLPTASESMWMPPAYSAAERLALTPFLVPSFADPGHGLRAWAQPFADQGAAQGGPRHTIAAMTEALRNSLAYNRRDAEGVQTPQQTLAVRAGACRDYATLMIDALRHLGIAARFVSGYLYSPQDSGIEGGGATHAWVQIYLPDCGWFAVDPTNNLIGGNDLIRIAVAREAAEVAPLTGEWYGYSGDYAGMTVDVKVVARS